MKPGAHIAAHRVFAVGLLCLGVTAAAYGTLQVTLGPRPVFIHVRWAPNVDETIRQESEQRYSLSQGELLEGRTWGYTLSDSSRTNIGALVSDAAVEDTQDIQRATFRVSPSAERLPYPPTAHPWIPVGLRVVTVLCLFIGLTSISLGLLERVTPAAVKEANTQLMAVAKSRNTFAVLWSVLIIVASSFALMIYELPHVYPTVQSEHWWVFLTPETWDQSSVVKELGLWENVTAVSFFVSGVILVARSVPRLFGANNSMWVPFLVGVVCLVVTAEEISYGQHFLGFTTPESVRSLNRQEETNVHNFFSNDINYYAVFLVFYGYIGVFSIIATYSQIVRALTLHLNIPTPPIAFARIMIPVFIVYSADLFIGREQGSLYGLREIRELMFALAILGTTINWRLTTCGESRHPS